MMSGDAETATMEHVIELHIEKLPEGVYEAKLSFYETPFALTLALRFSGDDLTYDSEYNVAFGPTRQPQLVGRAE